MIKILQFVLVVWVIAAVISRIRVGVFRRTKASGSARRGAERFDTTKENVSDAEFEEIP